MISSLDRHCLVREPDGSSNIVKERSMLNRVLQGLEHEPDKDNENYGGGLSRTLKALYAGGVKKPAAQSERPYLRIVLSASPEYFRPDSPEAVGTWDVDRLASWKEATMNQHREEHGADLIFAELHLDEDTPHIHAVVAPTYLKKARVPGKQKRGETPEQFEERKALARASEGVRTVGRASHPTLSKQGSFQRLRERMTVAVDHLGIEYGEDRSVDAPDGQSTREWVIEQAAEMRKEGLRLLQERAQFETEQDKAKADLEKAAEWVERGVRNLSVSIDRVQAGTYDTERSLADMPDQPTQFEGDCCINRGLWPRLMQQSRMR
ncbi:plasmid recombination protein [Nereida sp. MMG025]|uniref:plasmid recombination protein n=1 Tax=Nereida sp. MMG025 TaxID=2909981 RepID=UPI001F38A23C|nr:plasmid recombination protein [Nereida sp. MMG025]MCF6446140.1 plasmid recombination protein [Nereida sp. MMG025]